jgi:hypothetical protein
VDQSQRIRGAGDFNNGIFKLGNMPSRITQLREGATKNFDFSSQKLSTLPSV